MATVYRHFSNKQELMQAVLAERIDGVVALMQRLESAEDPMAGLREFFFTVGEMQQTDRGAGAPGTSTSASPARPGRPVRAGRRPSG